MSLTQEQWASLEPWLKRIEDLERDQHNTDLINAENVLRLGDIERRLGELERRLDVIGTRMYWKQDVT